MLFSDIWSENTALFVRLMEIHSNPPILYYRINCPLAHLTRPIRILQCGAWKGIRGISIETIVPFPQTRSS